MGSTQATAPAKGFIFQAYYGLYFVFLNKNYKNISSIDIEGKEEDIVIHYKDKSLDLIQVKTAEIPRKDKSFHADRFEKGLGTLLTSLNKSIADGIEVNRCIYTNNFINQGIDWLTTKVDEGREENFVMKFTNFGDDEIKRLEKYISLQVKDKLYLARIDDSYFSDDNRKILEDLKELIKEFNLSAKTISIYTHLRDLFTHNSTKKIEIPIEKVAWTFIKHEWELTDYYKPFNELFCLELDNLDIQTIEDLIDGTFSLDLIENISSHFNLHLELKSSEISHKLKNPDTKIFRGEILKEFVESHYHQFLNKDYLYIDTPISIEEKILLYKFLLFFLYRKNRETNKIYNEFELEGVFK